MSQTVVRNRNSMVAVRRSLIHGRGLFATAAIPEGTMMGIYEGPRTQRDGKYVLWVLEEDGSGYGVKGSNELRFMNHSPRPNAELCGQELYALRLIEAGEEITIHYGDDWKDS